MSTTVTPARATAFEPGPPRGTMVPRPFLVTATRRDTRDTHTLHLQPADGGPLEFRAGQFTMLHAFGRGEAPISISGDPADPATLQHTIRDVGPVSQALARAPVGSVLGVRGPFGSGWEVRDGKGGDVVVVAGGIGLAPLRPAILEVLRARPAYDRVTVLYGARTPEEILFPDELRRWPERRVLVDVTVDSGPYAWRGNVGLVTELVHRARFDPERTLALVCGPEVMMRHTARALVDRGVPEHRVRLSMERNMKCGVGLCGHCQLREHFLCVDGPVLGYDVLRPLMSLAEL